MRKELLLGCGANLTKKLFVPPFTGWCDLVTLDHNPDHHPMVLFDLEKIATGLRLPFEDETFDEIHAYEVCEHVTGQQGDAPAFFAFFTEMARILKPQGHFFGAVPRGEWVWGDPSHKRQITLGTLMFLSQREYREQVGITAMSDYRNIYKADFEVVWADQTTEAQQLRFVLQKQG